MSWCETEHMITDTNINQQKKKEKERTKKKEKKAGGEECMLLCSLKIFFLWIQQPNKKLSGELTKKSTLVISGPQLDPCDLLIVVWPCEILGAVTAREKPFISFSVFHLSKL